MVNPQKLKTAVGYYACKLIFSPLRSFGNRQIKIFRACLTEGIYRKPFGMCFVDFAIFANRFYIHPKSEFETAFVSIIGKHGYSFGISSRIPL